MRPRRRRCAVPLNLHAMGTSIFARTLAPCVYVLKTCDLASQSISSQFRVSDAFQLTLHLLSFPTQSKGSGPKAISKKVAALPPIGAQAALLEGRPRAARSEPATLYSLRWNVNSGCLLHSMLRSDALHHIIS